MTTQIKTFRTLIVCSECSKHKKVAPLLVRPICRESVCNECKTEFGEDYLECGWCDEKLPQDKALVCQTCGGSYCIESGTEFMVDNKCYLCYNK